MYNDFLGQSDKMYKLKYIIIIKIYIHIYEYYFARIIMFLLPVNKMFFFIIFVVNF